MRWIPFTSSESDADEEDETPRLRQLLSEENLSETKTEFNEISEEEPEQIRFFTYALGVAGGFVGLLYYFDGWLPWYVVVAYVFLIFIGLQLLFDKAHEKGPSLWGDGSQSPTDE